MSDYNRQFLFESEPYDLEEKQPSIFERIKNRGATLTTVGAVAIGAIVGAGAGAGAGIAIYNYSTRPAPIVINDTENVSWITGAAANASPSVVTIDVSSTSGAGNGSGVFLTADGYVLTNNHVVTLDGATSSVDLQVKTFDGHIYPATVVGTDPINDLAVIKIKGGANFTPIKVANSDRLNVGDRVVAIGAPLGLPNTVTEGIVSALNRTIQVSSSAVPENSNQGLGGLQLFSGSGASINLRVIQTDAAINPGNSGGALVNDKGELVGINVAIASAGGSSSGNIGVGFAIPANVAMRVANEIKSTGKASHALLGAGVVDAHSTSDNSGFSTGALVKELTAGGAAEKGGLKVGDIVTKFNDAVVTDAGELTSAVRQEPAGAKANITVLRNGKTLVLPVTLGDASQLK